jgi:hypothetical protein
MNGATLWLRTVNPIATSYSSACDGKCSVEREVEAAVMEPA